MSRAFSTPARHRPNKPLPNLTGDKKTGKAALNTFAELAAFFKKEEPKPPAPPPAPAVPERVRAVPVRVRAVPAVAPAVVAALPVAPAAAGGLTPVGQIQPSGRWPVQAKPIRVNGHVVLPCVTTTWRAAQWGRPKTARGATCYATPDMWVSRYWPRVGTVHTPSGRALPVYLRTV